MNFTSTDRTMLAIVIIIVMMTGGFWFGLQASATEYEQPTAYWTVQCDPAGVQIHVTGTPGDEVTWSFGGYPERTFVIGRSGIATDTQLIDGHAETGIAEAVIGSSFFTDHVVCDCDHSTTTTTEVPPSTTTTTPIVTTTTTSTTRPQQTSTTTPATTTTSQPDTSSTVPTTTVSSTMSTSVPPPESTTTPSSTTSDPPTMPTPSTPTVPERPPTTEPHEDSPVLPDTGGGEETVLAMLAGLLVIGGAGAVRWARR